MGGIIHKEEFYAIKCGKDNIILGLPWLNWVNPTINWINKHVNIHEATDQTEEYNLATSSKPFTIRKAAQDPPTHPELLPWEHEKEEPIYPDKNFINYVRGAQYVYTKGTNRFQMIDGKLRPLTVAKTSIASKLAQKVEETQVTLHEEYAEYKRICVPVHLIGQIHHWILYLVLGLLFPSPNEYYVSIHLIHPNPTLNIRLSTDEYLDQLD